MQHKFIRLLSVLLALAALLGILTASASAASLQDSSSVKITYLGRHEYLSKTTGGTLGGSSWSYTSNDGVTGTAYCVNWGLTAVSSSKSLTLQEYDRSPQTMGAFANSYPMRSLEQFKELHAADVRGIANLTEDEYQYASQVAIWATCGQISVSGTSFTAGRAGLVEPTADAQQIRIYDSVVAILNLAVYWTKNIYTGMSIRAEENQDLRAVEIISELGLEGAAADNVDGIRKETINGQDYYTRIMYVSSATSTWIDDYTTKIYSTDAPQGTIFTTENNGALETESTGSVTYYIVDTSNLRDTNLNSNGSEYYGAFKVCIPVDSAAEEGSFTIRATGGAAQYNLFLAYNPAATEQSYIVADPGYTTLEASATFTWSSTGSTGAGLQVVKVDGGGTPLEGAAFTLTGSGGTTVTGVSDRNGQIIWKDLPAEESYVLTETEAPEGYTVVDPINVTLTAGRTAYVTVQDNSEKSLQIKKIDAQNKSSLQGAVFRFEQIDGSYVTTGTTGFDGVIQFVGDDLPYGSYRITEESAPTGYQKDTSVETIVWTGEEDVTLTFENVRNPSLTLVKKDAQTGVCLPGAVFDVYADGTYLTSVTTNDAGEAYITGIQEEAYIQVVETAAPQGYVLDRTSHGIHISPYDPSLEDDPVLTVTNQAQPALRIVKYDGQTLERLSGVTFAVYRDSSLIGEYVTDENGEIFLYDLDPGTYLVQEVSTQASYVVNSTPQEIELEAGAVSTYHLVFLNYVKPGIHLVKLDSQTMEPLVNARFRISQVGGSFSKEYTTDANGEIDLTGLDPGSYLVEELEAPDNYLIDDAQRVIKLEAGEDAQFVFTDTEKPSLRLVKQSADGTPLAGVTFRIARIEDGSRYLDRTTDENGEITISGLEPGVYSVQETATVSDHILDTAEYHVELFAGQTSTIVLENDKRPNLIVYKHDADTGEPVADTVFLVEAADGHSVDEIRTDKEGKAVLENLLPGVYQITEKSVPSGYLMDAAPQLVTLYPNRDHTAYFENHKKPTLTVNKVSSVTGDPIQGAKFQVWYASNNTTTGELNDLGYYSSDENGQFTITDLQDGWYKITEIEPAAGYSMKDPSTQEVYISGGESKTVTFENIPLSALIVYKYDSATGAAIQGAVFQVSYLGGSTSGTGGTTIGTYQTSVNGSFTVTGLQAGTYIVQELASDSGHVIDTAPQTVYISGEEQDVVTLYFGNSPKGALLVRKIDSVTREPLSDVQFFVTTSDGSVVGDGNGYFTTDSAGTILIENIDPGTTLVVRETIARSGYVLDDTPQTAQIQAGQTVTLEFRNAPKGGLIVRKIDSETNEPLAGVEFKITTASGELVADNEGLTSSNGLYTTDENGQIVLSKLQPGTYIVTETRTLDTHILDAAPQTVVVGEGDTQTLTFRNTPKGSLLITKVDSVTREPISGVEFQIVGCDGCDYPSGTYTTDANGSILLSNVPSGSYAITETRAKDGYLLDDATHTVKVTGGSCKEVTFENTPLGGLVIKKMDAVTKEPLSDVVFKVTTVDGTVVGVSNGEFRTDENGYISIPELEPGGYIVQEVKAKDGYLLDDTPKTIEIKDHQTYVLEFFNQPLGGLIIHKLDSVTKEPLEGVQFKITYADGAVVDADGGQLSSNGLYWTDENGQITVTGITGTVVVTEVQTIDGYTIHEETRSQTVVVNANDTQTLYFYNDPIGGVEIIKVNEADKAERIPNTTFEIRRIDDELMDTVTTGSKGRVFVSLEDGAYYAVEIEAADGYKLDSTPHYFEVEDGKTVVLTVSNTPFSGILIHKTDSTTGEGIYGVTFLLYDTNKNPIGQYVSDQNGYVYIDDLPSAGCYYLRELENEGYILDTQLKTIYVTAGTTTEVAWENTPITGQIQITKTSADYNSMNGWAAGTPIPGTIFEIYNDRTGKLVDTVETDKNGVAVSKPLPLGRYQVIESQAADFYGLDKTPIDVEIEFAGQIVKAAMTNKSLYTNVSIQKTGYSEVMPGQSIRYDFAGIANNSTTSLTSFYWRDTLPTQAVRLDKIVTGTYNVQGNYKIVYRTNLSGENYRTLADNLSTQQNYVLDASAAALGLASNEYVTEFMVSFGVVPANFRQVEAPQVYCIVVSWLTGGTQFTNQADVGGVYDGQWIMAISRWVTKVYMPSQPLPRTGY